MKHNFQFKVIFKNYYLFIRDFFSDLFDDKLGHYASSLAWSTLFSILPLMVIVFSVFTSMPIFDSVYSKIETLIFSNLMPTDSKVVMEYINTFMQSTDKLGYIGAGYVTFAVIMFFKNYDYIVNDIFNTASRSLWKASKTYLLLLILIPTILGLSYYISSFAQVYLDANEITSSIHIFTFLPFLMTWMTFYVAYQLSANIHIDIQAAAISSFIASLIWFLSKMGFVFYVVHNKTYESIYGSVSTLLFFFLWIYISWAIFIHGLKFCDLLNRDEEIEHI
ncbi:MAG: Inner membrane protein YihY, formerly thought to be RNase BN [uncultured Sulfurovum sp.]|uniref:Inner membrane protein YihY, formerly thought to be RNase BN n=1 Tax=uncultured Sulfurovum sp. TaxID=269237 RepID=A0A6S6TMF3_9BACT|nr:MAG: Inner membrane protein YihY, formerly thought to be RNase BN [uncultured Sulfurovum sp.]